MNDLTVQDFLTIYKVRKYYRKLVPASLRRLVRAGVESLPVVYKKLSLEFMAKRFVQGCEMDTPQAHLYWRYTLRDFEKRGLKPLAADGAPPTDSLFAKLFYSLDYPDELNRISAVDFRYYLMGDMLLKNDRMLSAHGVEPRVPYLDRRLVEFANSVPTELKLRGMSGRYIQKKAVKDLLPPESVGNLDSYLHFEHSPDGGTVLKISPSGEFTGNAAHDAQVAYQSIELQNVDLLSLGSDQQIIDNLLKHGKLITE